MLAVLWLVVVALAAPGEIEPEVTCVAHADTRYALYLPSAWTPQQRWPLLLVLDPRGRAVAALERFVPAAEQLGWVVASAYDSASDTLGPNPTGAAVAAILSDLPVRAHIDQDGVVLAGFSGTARIAWEIGSQASPVVVGVIGVGAATATGRDPAQAPPFLWYGLAGTTDFNHGEVLTAAQAIHRHGGEGGFERFEGTHQWPGPEPITRALGWLTLRAEQHGRIDIQPGRAEQVLHTARAHVVDLGASWEAWLHARAHAPELRAEADALWSLRPVRRRARIEVRIAASERDAGARIAEMGTWLQDSQRKPPRPVEARALFDATALERLVARAPASPRGQSAARLLALAQATSGFYAPQRLRLRDDHARVAASLEVAVSLPGSTFVTWYNLACAHALAGHPERALASLEQAARRGYRDRAHATTDPDLSSLHDRPEFQSWLETFGG